MKTSINGHNMEITPALRELTEKKLEKLASHYDNITSIEVTFQVDKLSQIAKAKTDIPGHKMLHASAESPDMYKTLDLLMSKLKHQIDKLKEKQTDH